ncbi:3-phosphoshikimate 1-carboxyvinyltransferase [Candidatus Alkanophaga liquidiphilum]|nr:5-enolpyruvylshikimate-3-phosphate synthase [Candidatus Alkanophaga liquidiphilum]RLG38662.1 MAG: 3-phosphoshikimate 1-carboxyvinyltransferase [Candidatus Alkanophagales archaeon]
MKAVIRSSEVKGEVFAPPSKSYTHRAIAVAAFSERCEILFPLLSGDTRATINAAAAFGAALELKGSDKLVVRGTQPKTPDDVVNAENSGTTLRIFTAVAALCDGITVLTGDASLRRRPNLPLLKSLNELGAKALSTKGDGTAPLIVKGRLKGGCTEIDASISSQFVSALLIAAPLAENPVKIIVSRLSSEPYVNITLDILKRAGVAVRRKKHERKEIFEVEPQSYDLRRFTVPGDFSSAAFILAAAVVSSAKGSVGEVYVKNLFPSAQGDVKILDILKKMGADVQWDEEKGVVCIKGVGRLRGVRVDARDIPDLVPTVAVLGTVAEGITEITNAAHLRHKETDRLKATAEELSKLGAKIKEKEDGLVIEGSTHAALHGTVVDSRGDHRIAMALAIAGLAADGVTVIEGAECVSISYPSFFEELKKLGVELELLG